MTRCRCLLTALTIACFWLGSAPHAPAQTDVKVQKQLQAIRDYVDSEDWTTVADAVQGLLDRPADGLVEVSVKGPDGKPIKPIVSVRTAANRILAGLPRDKPGVGRDVYNNFHGPAAKKLLDDAKKEKEPDVGLLAEAAERFLYTDAGREAAERLAVILLARGDTAAAARTYERLIERDGVEQFEPLTLYNAARAFARGGTKEDQENKEKVWKRLTVKAPKGLRIDGRDRSLKDLEEDLREPAKAKPTNVQDWLLVGGTPSRDGQGDGGAAFLQPLWRTSLFSGDTSPIKMWIDGNESSAVRRLEGKGEAVIPPFAPVTATVTTADGKQKTLVVYRGYEGVAAIELKRGKREWISYSPWSLERMHKDGQKQPTLTAWVGQFKDQYSKPTALLENSTVGTLSSDGQRVYLIDDLQLPPFPPMQQFNQWGGGMPGGGTGAYNQWVNPGVQANTLQAINIGSGKLSWLLGGPKTPGDDDGPVAHKHDFRDTHFLGVPLPLDGKLYFLNEKDREIRLICLDTRKLPARDPQAKDLDAAIAWVQPLGTAKEKILVDYRRRITAVHIAYGEGILVCPLNTGALVGVDLLTHSLLWVHTYAEPPAPLPPAPPGRPSPPPGFAGTSPVVSDEWKASAPVVQAGKVVFAAHDSPALNCLNLRDGRLLWGSKRRDDDVYLAAVFAGKVVIVGKKEVRALKLDDGTEVWRVPTGMPSGRGAAADNVYYLPLKEALFSDKEKGPGIFAIDIVHGKIVAQTRSKKNREGALEVPGNLTFFDGQVISQSASDLTAYPLMKAKLKEIDEELKKDPNNPRGRFERGELRLDKGDLAGAVEDFRAALNNEPPPELKPRAEAKLFDAMTDLLQRDFNNGEKYLDQYQKLCVVELPNPQEAKKESQRRRANFLCLVARGREAQGKLGEALASYLEFGSLPMGPDELLSVVDEPAVKTKASVWAQGRIKAMLERATPEQRKPLEELSKGKWKEVKDSGDLDKQRRFVEMFGSTAASGKEGRLYLADRLMERESNAALLDTELQFYQLANDDDPALVARALDGLARLMTRKGELADAFHYYKALKARFPTTPVRDGKTGTQLLEGLATDKRFLQFMDEAGDVVGKLRFKGVLERDKNFNPGPEQQIYTFDPINEPLPSLRQHRFGVNPGNNQLKLIDRLSGRELLTEPLNENFAWFINPQTVMTPGLGVIYPNPAATNRFGYRSVGHLIVANLGQYVVAVDAITHKLLWQKNLLGADNRGTNQSLHYDAAEESLHMYFTDGTYLAIAQGGPVEATYVCVLTREGLEALDPLTGKTLWTRNDVPMRCRLFGDAQHIYLVELNNANPPVPSTTRAFRARDGASVVVPNFAALYQKKLRIIGREMLVADTLGSGRLTLRLYDVHTGKDTWSQDFPANTTVLHSEDPDLAGVIGPDGRVTVVSLSRRKVVLGGIVDLAHLKNLRHAHLLADAQTVYVMFHTVDPNDRDGLIESNLQSNSGLRGITVNGEVYAFNRRTSRVEWHNEIRKQQLVLEQWQEMPVLLFTSRAAGRLRPGEVRDGPQGITFEAYEKSSGRLFFRNPARNDPALEGKGYGQIYAVNYDPRAGTISLIAPSYKVTITQQREDDR